MNTALSNTRIVPVGTLEPPARVKRAFPASYDSLSCVEKGRREVEEILEGEDPRLLVIVGPCSIHDEASALAYAGRLAMERHRYKKKLCIIMRSYFEKPRTTIGWKGLINDPLLDNSYEINKGSRLAREILCKITHRGLPVATEFVTTRTPQFLDDLVSYAAIGARTVESQVHREMASGLSMPVGFKNGTSGDIRIAADAVRAAMSGHFFCGVDHETGSECVFKTAGNPYGHLILRGGKHGPNYGPEEVAVAIETVRNAGVCDKIIIDCSHANAGGDYRRQMHVARSVVAQRNAGNRSVVGIMLESHLVAGRQDFGSGPLTFGQSITDACLGWGETAVLLEELYDSVHI